MKRSSNDSPRLNHAADLSLILACSIVIYWDRVAAKDRRRQNHQSTDRLSAPGEEGIGEKYYTGAEKQILQFL